ncbi:unnamed protein product [Periconia digitata]|uniref:BTB domain-containing protein n=1 Tax=Periconia digitata TaxID=1303443 RepID=A0A9W4XRA0_9PLEO|nr:unnamed protein product [Periconia digitata]
MASEDDGALSSRQKDYSTYAGFANDPMLSDVRIRYGDAGERVFHGHRILFATQSEWFRAATCGNFAESNMSEITLKDGNTDALELVLATMYSPRTLREINSGGDMSENAISALCAYKVADKYIMNDVRAFFKSRFAYSIENLVSTVVQDDFNTQSKIFINVLEELYDQTIDASNTQHELSKCLLGKICFWQNGIFKNHLGKIHELVTASAKEVPVFSQHLVVHLMKNHDTAGCFKQELSWACPVVCGHCGNSWMLDYNASISTEGHCWHCGKLNRDLQSRDRQCMRKDGCECHGLCGWGW